MHKVSRDDVGEGDVIANAIFQVCVCLVGFCEGAVGRENADGEAEDRGAVCFEEVDFVRADSKGGFGDFEDFVGFF